MTSTIHIKGGKQEFIQNLRNEIENLKSSIDIITKISSDSRFGELHGGIRIMKKLSGLLNNYKVFEVNLDGDTVTALWFGVKDGIHFRFPLKISSGRRVFDIMKFQSYLNDYKNHLEGKLKQKENLMLNADAVIDEMERRLSELKDYARGLENDLYYLMADSIRYIF